MQIYVLRHAIAEDAAPSQSDADRRLTPLGKKKLRKVLARARDAGVAPDVVLTSPYIRAVETAAIASEELATRAEVIETENLAPFSSPAVVWEELRGHREAKQLMLVGHNPLLSDLVCFLIGAGEDSVDLKKGALAYVEEGLLGPRPQGALVWLLTPKTAGA